MKLTKIFLTIAIAFSSLNVWAQTQSPAGTNNPSEQWTVTYYPNNDRSKSITSCLTVDGEKHSRVESKNGQLYCDNKEPVLWDRATEFPNGDTNRIQTITPSSDGSLPQVTQVLGKFNDLPTPVKIDNQALSKIEGMEDDLKASGQDLFVDKFIIERGGKVVRNYRGKNPNYIGKVYAIQRKDSETGMTVENGSGVQTPVTDASSYGFYTLAIIDEDNAQEFKDEVSKWYLYNISHDHQMKNSEGITIASKVILPGTAVCTKPKKYVGVKVGSRKRAYARTDQPGDYCYENTLGIDLPSGLKPNGKSKMVTIILVLPYSQQSADGREDDNVAMWASIPKSDFDKAKYILLTSGENASFSKVVIGLTKTPYRTIGSGTGREY
jgi:hypothetical protein